MFFYAFESDGISDVIMALTALMIGIYLIRLKPRSRPTVYLSGLFFATAAYLAGIGFGMAVQRTMLNYYIRAAGTLFLTSQTAFLIQFSYHFPQVLPAQEKERRLAGFLSLLAIAAAALVSANDLIQIHQGNILQNGQRMLLVAGGELVWSIILCFRRTVIFSRQADASISWQQALLHPRGRPALANRWFGILNILGLFIYLSLAALNNLSLPYDLETTGILLNNLGGIAWFLLMALTYLNMGLLPSSVLIKISGGMLVFIAAILIVTANMVGRNIATTFINPNLPVVGERLQLVPNLAGGYTASQAGPAPEGDLGLALVVRSGGSARVELPFAFPFAGQDWEQIYINEDGVVTFDQPFKEMLFRAQMQPAIAPLLANLEQGQGIYLKAEPAQATISWVGMPLAADPDGARNTFQLGLFPDGRIEFSYQQINARPPYHKFLYLNAPAFTGLATGTPGAAMDRLPSLAALPYAGQASGGIMAYHFTDYRTYMHQRIIWIIYLCLGLYAFLLVGVPLFYRVNLLEPIDRLLTGVHRLQAGELGATVKAQYRDEIGFLADGFNDMSRTLRAQNDDLHHYQENLEELVEQRTAELARVVKQLETEVEKSHRLQISESHARQVAESLQTAGAVINSTLDLNTMLALILEQAHRVLSPDMAEILLYNGDTLERAALLGQNGQSSRQIYLELDAHSPYRFILEERRMLYIPDTQGGHAMFQAPPYQNVRAWLGIPLLSSYRIGGILTIGSSRPQCFKPEDQHLAEAYGYQVAVALENARLFAEVERMAITDSLTGLSNRRRFFEMGEDEFQRASRLRRSLSVLFLDVDYFKMINDLHGHACGDESLIALANIIRQTMRRGDILARLGGEEFGVLMPDTGIEQTYSAAERLRQAICEDKIPLHNNDIHITVSIGVSEIHPGDGHFSDLLARADRALYAAKDQGRNQVCVL
ncbi:MAG: diguanylate cyclase [Chloroflexi bacterium]|nr:diguanylate cyclase [Chloroflexota bacterium]